MNAQRKLEMEPSTLWLITIVFGASLVALANIQYARARDAEKKTVAAQQARSLLDPELRRNSATARPDAASAGQRSDSARRI
jgi:hypothetical protein